MIKKRKLSGKIVVLDGWEVFSFGYIVFWGLIFFKYCVEMF